MSRVGKKIINIPSGVEAKIAASHFSAKGPKGELAYDLPAGISLKVDGATIQLSREKDDAQSRALHGLARSLVQNIITGVSVGFTKSLEIIGVGYKADVKPNKIDFTLGFSHSVPFTLPAGIKAEVEKGTNVLKISGCDRQLVGEMAAQIRDLKKPEPYKGTGIKYVGEVILRKAGKAAATGAGK